MARRPATLQNEGERWVDRINTATGTLVRNKENNFGIDQGQGIDLADL